MVIKKPSQVAAKPVEMEGAKDVTVRMLLGPEDGVPTFAMRIFELAGAGHTPYHDHPFEHEVMVLSGNIAVATAHGDTPLDIGDVILIEPDETHQFKNLSETEPASFMCLVPIEFQK